MRTGVAADETSELNVGDTEAGIGIQNTLDWGGDEERSQAHLFHGCASMDLAKSFALGSIGAGISTTLLQPLDLIKTRLQLGTNFTPKIRSFTDRPSSRSRHKCVNETQQIKNALNASSTFDARFWENRRNSKILDCVGHVVRTEGVRGLWRGLTASLIRSCPGVGLYFCALDALTTVALGNASSDQCRRRLTASEALALGIGARCIAGTLLHPATVIKTRFESGLFLYQSLGPAARSIVAAEGVRGFYRGLLPTLARDAPFSGLYLLFYTQLKTVSSAVVGVSKSTFTGENNAVGKTNPELNKSAVLTAEQRLSATTRFACGLLAGVAASVVTQPADVLKTRMQAEPARIITLREAVVSMARFDGPLAFFSGLTPRLLRRALMSAFTWSFYEHATINASR